MDWQNGLLFLTVMSAFITGIVWVVAFGQWASDADNHTSVIIGTISLAALIMAGFESHLLDLWYSNLDKSGKAWSKHQDRIRMEFVERINDYTNEQVAKELEHWLGMVTWPNNYAAMQEDFKERINQLRNLTDGNDLVKEDSDAK